MLEFYKLQPPQSSVYRQHNPILKNYNGKMERVTEPNYEPDFDIEDIEAMLSEQSENFFKE